MEWDTDIIEKRLIRSCWDMRNWPPYIVGPIWDIDLERRIGSKDGKRGEPGRGLSPKFKSVGRRNRAGSLRLGRGEE